MFQVSTKKFVGPLDLLLTLIEKEELPISEVSLAQVTGDYLKFIDEHEVPVDELADFLTVAARLLLIKSNSILPSPEVEAESPDLLAIQLRIYREFVSVARQLEERWNSPSKMYQRPDTPLIAPGFHPPSGLSVAVLSNAFDFLLKKLEPFFSLQKAALERVASIEERVREIRRVIMKRAKLAFSDVLGAAKSRAEVVVSFLALLELVRLKTVKAQQSKMFEEIVLTRN